MGAPRSAQRFAMLTSRLELDNQASAQHQAKRQRGRLAILIVLSVIMLAAGLIAMFPRQVIYQLKISIIRQPVPYTQLFFSNPATLPDRLHVNRRYIFSFTIINDEGRSQIYRYSVAMSTSGSHSLVSRGSLNISDQQTVTRAVVFIPNSRNSRYLIAVTLNKTGQSIHFYGDTP